MMIVPTTKVLLRGDLVTFQQLVEMLYRIADEIERLLDGAPSRYLRWSRASILTTPAERRDAVEAICRRVDAMTPAAIVAGAIVSEKRWVAVGPWLEALSATAQ